MSDNIVISVQGVSKAYRIWDSPAGRLTSPLFQKVGGLFPIGSSIAQTFQLYAAKSYRDFWALKDITFRLKKGEATGILGRNGSGKSTLLQIIAGTLQPSAGQVSVIGRVAALLELGSGFNPDFTGRENIYLNASILGLTKAKINARFAEITSFADIDDFIEQPVKTYSSGMIMRLAFAVQSAVDPDILIIDEALSVGDAPFQAKCFARIREIQNRGCSILFVSHDVGAVRSFCQNALWIKDGHAQAQGGATDVCDAYNRDCLRAAGMRFEETPGRQNGLPAVRIATNTSTWLMEDRGEFSRLAAIDRHGSGLIQLRNFFFVDESGKRSDFLHWDKNVTAVFVLGTKIGYDGLFQIGMVCKTLQGQELLCCSDRTHGKRIHLEADQECAVKLETKISLRAGKYSVTAGIFLFPDDARFSTGTYDFTRATVSDFVGCGAIIEIAPQFNLGIYGPVQQESQLSFASP